MSSVNKAIIVGNLGRDPEMRATQSGDRICHLSVATSESWRDKNSGERRERTEWHRVVIFNPNLVKVAEAYLRKGSKVYLEGAIQTRKWTDQQGQDRYSTEIVLQNYRGELVMLDSKEGGKPDDDFRGNEGGSGTGVRAGGQGPADINDDIPFAAEVR